MDIDFLLWLQSIRTEYLTSLALFISDLIPYMKFPAIFIYWCINKKKGLFVLVSFGLSYFINGLLKGIFCVYRPFIKDSRVIPLDKESGYSFPSGHAMLVTPLLGGYAVLCRKKAQIISWIMGLLIILMILSRLYIGVHTPQDVIAGVLLSLLTLYITVKIFAFIERRPESEKFFLLTGIIMCIAAFVYLYFKSYPVDYDSAGKILVKPDSARASTIGNIGNLAGLIIGYYIDKKFIKFSYKSVDFRGVLLAVIGIAFYYYFASSYIEDALKILCSSTYRKFMRYFIESIFIVVIWPVVIKLFTRK